MTDNFEKAVLSAISAMYLSENEQLCKEAKALKRAYTEELYYENSVKDIPNRRIQKYPENQ